MKSRRTVIVFFLILFTACSPEQVNMNTLTPIETLNNTETPIIPTRTVSIESTQTLSPTIPSTRVIPALTQTAISLIEENWQVCERAMYPGWNNALSDNGQWLTVECDLNMNNRTFTKVFRLDGTQSWDVPFYETAGANLKSESFPDGFEAGVMMPFHWSKDGNYLYLSPRILYLDGPWLDFVNGFGLYRLDLNTGKTSKTLSANAYAFSPNDRYLAYISQNGNLEILDIFTGEVVAHKIASSSLAIGKIIWSPGSGKLTFIKAFDELWDQNGYFTLYYYDFENNSLTELLTQDPRSCIAKEWVSDVEILLIGATDASSCHQIYNVETKTFKSFITPTP